MIDPSKNAEQLDKSPDTRKMPPTFDPAYVQGAVKQFFLDAIYQGERPLLPMIDLTLSKEAAMPAHIFGMLYDHWKPNMEEEGLPVFLQGYPTLQGVHDNYMRVRQLRQLLKGWIDQRVQDLIDGRVPNPEKTLAYYWIKNGALGENFRRKDLVFECFHNFLAFSQWGNTLYNIMARLQATNGDPAVRSWFEKTMRSGPDETDNSAFSRLDRFVMELFRTISPNKGSTSALPAREQAFGTGYTGFSTIITPHPETSRDPLHWTNPNDFDPDRYKQAPTSEQNDETRCKQVGLAQCPFSREALRVKDGRQASITNSTFGAVYARVDEQAYPVCDDAGYAPFGFGYRRCAGEFLTIGLFKDLLRKVWSEKIAFTELNIDHAELLPVGPGTVVPDNIGFKRAQ